jgi:hypothetical protein
MVGQAHAVSTQDEPAVKGSNQEVNQGGTGKGETLQARYQPGLGETQASPGREGAEPTDCRRQGRPGGILLRGYNAEWREKGLEGGEFEGKILLANRSERQGCAKRRKGK